jgi:prepilin-type N-terminal cleavage/methylation domain-containing protein
MRTHPDRARERAGERGFSLVEILVVAALSAVLMAMAVVQIGASRASMNADSAMRHVMSELNRARDTAVAQRRNVRIEVVGINEIRLTRINVPAPAAGTTLLRSTFMVGNVRFMLAPFPPDTPDLFLAASIFTGTGNYIFNSDGMLVDNAGTTINGTIFLAAPNEPSVTRAVTVLGSTGRVRGYRRLNTVWARV